MFRRLAHKRGLLFGMEGQVQETRRMCTVRDDEFMLYVYVAMLLVEKLKEL